MKWPFEALWWRLADLLGKTTGIDFVVQPRTAGRFIVRQPGGVAGTDEVQVSYDGGDTVINIPETGAAGFSFKVNGTTRARFFWDTVKTILSFGGISAARLSGVYDVNGVTGFVFGDKVITTSPICWLQLQSCHKRLNTAATSVSNTLANTTLAWTLIAGRSYTIKIRLAGGNGTAVEGAKFALTADGTLTATTYSLAVIGSNGTLVAGTTRVTSLGSAINFTTFTIDSDVYLIGEIKCGVAGVLTLQIATNAFSIGTLTMNAGSWGELNDALEV